MPQSERNGGVGRTRPPSEDLSLSLTDSPTTTAETVRPPRLLTPDVPAYANYMPFCAVVVDVGGGVRERRSVRVECDVRGSLWGWCDDEPFRRSPDFGRLIECCSRLT